MSWAIVTLALALDAAKLTAVTVAYKYWKKLGIGIRGYLLPAITVLMLITAIGSYGFLIEKFQGSIQDNRETVVKIEAAAAEKTKLEARKIEIDKQVASLPANYVKGRQKLLGEFKEEIDRTNKRIVELDKQIPELKTHQIGQETHIGPIAVLAKVMGVELEVAIQLIVILIVLVMDPLAVVLILAGNRMLEIRDEEANESAVSKRQAELDEERFKIQKEKLRLEEKEVELQEAVIDAKKESSADFVAPTTSTPSEKSLAEMTEDDFAWAHGWSQSVDIPDLNDKLTEEEVDLLNDAIFAEPEPTVESVEQLEEVIEEPIEVVRMVEPPPRAPTISSWAESGLTPARQRPLIEELSEFPEISEDHLRVSALDDVPDVQEDLIYRGAPHFRESSVVKLYAD